MITRDHAAQHFGAQADASVFKPGLRVDPNEACHLRLGEDGQHRSFGVLIPFKYLLAWEITLRQALQFKQPKSHPAK